MMMGGMLAAGMAAARGEALMETQAGLGDLMDLINNNDAVGCVKEVLNTCFEECGSREDERRGLFVGGLFGESCLGSCLQEKEQELKECKSKVGDLLDEVKDLIGGNIGGGCLRAALEECSEGCPAEGNSVLRPLDFDCLKTCVQNSDDLSEECIEEAVEKIEDIEEKLDNLDEGCPGEDDDRRRLTFGSFKRLDLDCMKTCVQNSDDLSGECIEEAVEKIEKVQDKLDELDNSDGSRNCLRAALEECSEGCPGEDDDRRRLTLGLFKRLDLDCMKTCVQNSDDLSEECIEEAVEKIEDIEEKLDELDNSDGSRNCLRAALEECSEGCDSDDNDDNDSDDNDGSVFVECFEPLIEECGAQCDGSGADKLDFADLFVANLTCARSCVESSDRASRDCKDMSTDFISAFERCLPDIKESCPSACSKAASLDKCLQELQECATLDSDSTNACEGLLSLESVFEPSSGLERSNSESGTDGILAGVGVGAAILGLAALVVHRRKNQEEPANTEVVATAQELPGEAGEKYPVGEPVESLDTML
eukprot:CAMPEP_0184559028 /NCGR_PEP_ID=MMETSP0199_2-20130426/46219_1 /TAXON_ID=1112570 /ORGANISM="Thraustochytrium sp., Strain LLF1b" /LENGTH=536 /DNA_ID=CAMNT_0026956307 /DNA_START=36 /DNA_END=1646 /DNA_ORIENTATION=+